MCRFLDAGKKEPRHARLTGVQKAPRHEVAEVGHWLGSECYGDLTLAPILMIGGTAARYYLDVPAREVGRVRQASRRALALYQSALGKLIAVIESSEIAAGAEPAH